MRHFARIYPYIWPHRRKIYMSIGCAIFVALLWGANLSVAFPVVKILLQGQSIDEYVQAEIVSIEEDIDDSTADLEYFDDQIEELEQSGEITDKSQHVKLIAERARQRRKLSSASDKLLMVNWAKTYVVPWIPRDQFDAFALILFMLLLATALKGAAIYLQDILVGSVVTSSVIGIRKECFRRALALDYESLSNRGTAQLMARFTNDTNMMAEGLNLLGGRLVREPLKAVSCITLAFFVNWRLTLLSLVFVPIIGYTFLRIGRVIKKASHRMLESVSDIYKTLEESFEAIKVVIAFDGAGRHRRKFHRDNKRFYVQAMSVVKMDALTKPTTEMLGLAAVFVAILPSAYLVLRETASIRGIRLAAAPMDIAELSVLYALLLGTLDPFRKLSHVFSALKRSGTATERVFEFLDQVPTIRDPQDPKILPQQPVTIEFDQVDFTYAVHREEKLRPAALQNVSLKVQAGEAIAVVGENGSGKSTLVNMLPRFFDPQAGTISINDVNIRDLRLRDLRRQIGVVTQETFLFDVSIRDNIAYGDVDATDEQIEAAARRAHVEPFLAQLPDGIDTNVGEKGRRLSGGQRQRIALARAILRDPPILILDEATSAIDAQSEILIHRVMKDLAPNRVIFVITHAVTPSILDFVTKIVVMDQGRIVAQGTHEKLIECCPQYQKLYHARVQSKAA